MDQELSQTVIEGLKHLNNSISPEISRKVIANALKQALNTGPSIPLRSDLYASNPEHIKRAEFAILVLLFLAVKHSVNSEQLTKILEGKNLSQQAISNLVEAYDLHKHELRNKSISFGPSMPHITDASWKLTCEVKSSIRPTSGDLKYEIDLGRHRPDTGERESVVKFFCSPTELQLLISKLKDIERHCEKVAVKA